MNPFPKSISGSIVAPKGFLAGGVFSDIKRLGTGKGSNKGKKLDLALILSEKPAVAAGMFTTNQVCAAPVRICLRHLRQRSAQAIVVNSGNANACTGARGLRDAEAMARIAAAALTSHQVLPKPLRTSDVLVASTGRIGVALPMSNVRAGIELAAGRLGRTTRAGSEAAEAIMTSDTKQKSVAVEFSIGRKKVRIGGICKGAGMIQPGMSPNGARPASAPHATMLCFLTSDVAIPGGVLQRCLREAVAVSFNRITVDGDMSTNDTVLILANGLAGNVPLSGSGGGRELAVFQKALSFVCLQLARMIVRDGEGVSRFVTVRVRGARSATDAEAAARSVANSALVKTSWCGGDPNWGRIIDALGYSAAKVAENRVDLAYSRPGETGLVYSLRHGRPSAVPFRRLCRIVAAPEFELHINLNLGRSSATIYSCDLTEQYVDFNKGAVGDPASLGG